MKIIHYYSLVFIIIHSCPYLEGVEAARGLVQEDHARAVEQLLRYRHALTCQLLFRDCYTSDEVEFEIPKNLFTPV